MRRRIHAIAAIGAVLAVLAALAADARANPLRTDRNYKRGVAYYDLEQYGDAAREFLLAFETLKLPAVLINVAQSYWRHGDKPSAVVYYRKYLELEPEGKFSSFARSQVDKLTAEIAEEAKTERARAEDDAAEPDAGAAEGAEPTPPGEDDAAAEDRDARPFEAAEAGSGAEPSAGPAVEPAADAGEEPRDRGRSRKLRVAGLATGGAGLLLVGVGALYGLEAQGIAGELSNVQWSDALQARYEEGQAAERNAIVAWSIGGAALIAGGVLYYLSVRAERDAAETGVVLVPFVTADSAGITAAGRF